MSSAKETGLAELGALGFNKGALNDQAGKLVGGILTALVTAGSAALTASKDANKTVELSADPVAAAPSRRRSRSARDPREPPRETRP